MNAQSITRRATVSRWATLLGYFGLLGLILNWFTWLSPPTEVPRAFLLIVLCVPLMFPLRGILHARTYTHSWVCFLSLFYFAIGIDVAFNRVNDRTLGLLMLGFSTLLFLGSVFFSFYEKKRRHLVANDLAASDASADQPVTDGEASETPV